MPDTRPQIAIRFSPEEAGVLRDAAHRTETLTAAVRRLLADGLRWHMTRGTSRPLSGWLLRELDEERIFELYEKYTEAMCAQVGLGGGYRFEVVRRRMTEDPPEVFWPLAQDEEFTNDGELIVKRALPPDADTFWQHNHRTFTEDGTGVICETPASRRRREYETWKREERRADDGEPSRGDKEMGA